ncbi:GNAT family N-acetyltransferase [Microbulbifer aggregans]|uniref:GNAT family N-acetyltransferase n=1 Tax=Microbulbifer aggregans TaxID=1769779 RepID=UPI001CFDEE44|nr:GNAT family N-acetyltransferase [Microbulbifer aggregans]
MAMDAETGDTEIEVSSINASKTNRDRIPKSPTGTEPPPLVARETVAARALLESWEHSEQQRDSEPYPIYASAEFFFPFLEDNASYRAPHIALWEHQGAPAGILVGRIMVARPKRALGPVAIPMPQLTTLEILHGGLESNSTEVAHRQLEYLRQLLASAEVDCISIHHLPANSEAGNLLCSGLRAPGDGNPTRSRRWLIQLTDANGQPLSSNSSKTRSSFRRQDRKLEEAFEGRVCVREVRTAEEVSAFIEAAATISEHSYHGGMGVGVCNNEHWRRILNIVAASGNLRGYLLNANGINIAYGVGAVYRGTFNAMATSFLPEYRTVRPGTFLLRRTIERLQNEGIHWFDFGYGGAAYKELYGNHCEEEATYHLYAHSRAATIARFTDALVLSINRGARRLLASAGVLDRLRQLWRRSLERFAR